MLLSELVLEGPKKTGYFAAFIARGEYRIEVWSDADRKDYDLAIAPLVPPWDGKSDAHIEYYGDLEPFIAQCVFFELLEKYPEK